MCGKQAVSAGPVLSPAHRWDERCGLRTRSRCRSASRCPCCVAVTGGAIPHERVAIMARLRSAQAAGAREVVDSANEEGGDGVER